MNKKCMQIRGIDKFLIEEIKIIVKKNHDGKLKDNTHSFIADEINKALSEYIFQNKKHAHKKSISTQKYDKMVGEIEKVKELFKTQDKDGRQMYALPSNFPCVVQFKIGQFFGIEKRTILKYICLLFQEDVIDVKSFDSILLQNNISQKSFQRSFPVVCNQYRKEKDRVGFRHNIWR